VFGGRRVAIRIFLPVTPGRESAGEAAVATPIPPVGKGEVVLVVDDEETVLRATEAVLRHHGYEVLLASDGVQAVAIFAVNSAASAWC